MAGKGRCNGHGLYSGFREMFDRNGKLEGTFFVTAAGKAGRLVLKGDRFVGARFGQDRGANALQDVLLLREGEFTWETVAMPDPASIDVPASEAIFRVLLDASELSPLPADLNRPEALVTRTRLAGGFSGLGGPDHGLLSRIGSGATVGEVLRASADPGPVTMTRLRRLHLSLLVDITAGEAETPVEPPPPEKDAGVWSIIDDWHA